jgi:glyoxylase-like metal-dependent hydrolase (beta-lactamase superfamily II)
MEDTPLEAACRAAEAALAGGARPEVAAIFDPDCSAALYVVSDPATRVCAIIDSVLGLDPASGRTSTASLDAVLAHVADQGLEVAWILETHVHADHLSAADALQARFGAPVGIGAAVERVRDLFAPALGLADAGGTGLPFDRLFQDGDTFAIGSLEAHVLAVPGHTPADVAYIIGDAVFVGDTLFMPDYGTARADFPGGDPRALYRSIRRLLRLPAATRMFSGHDYKAPGRDSFAWESTVAGQRAGNVHVRDDVDEGAFVDFRTRRDAILPAPRLLWPSLQVNLNGGRLPPPGPGGLRRLTLPLDAL